MHSKVFTMRLAATALMRSTGEVRKIARFYVFTCIVSISVQNYINLKDINWKYVTLPTHHRSNNVIHNIWPLLH